VPIIFQICHVYNKIFYRNLNELASCLPVITLFLCGAFWPSPVLGSCKTE
jgi:hypothetical protein